MTGGHVCDFSTVGLEWNAEAQDYREVQHCSRMAADGHLCGRQRIYVLPPVPRDEVPGLLCGCRACMRGRGFVT